MSTKEDFFPLVVEYVDTNERVLVEKPEEIDDERTFRIIKTQATKTGGELPPT